MTTVDEKSARATGLAAQVFTRSSLPMLMTGLDGRICAVNAAMEHISGFSAAELVGERPSLMRSALQGPEFYAQMWTELLAQGRWQGEIWNRRKDGRVFRDWLAISSLLDEQGRVCHYLGQYSGLGLASRSHEPVQALDPGTGVLNREAFLAAANRLGRRGETMALMTLDIDHFTDLNERLGLEAGDRLLRLVAQRCTELAPACGLRQLVGRVGADEFALAWVPAAPTLPGVDPLRHVQTTAQHVHDAIGTCYELGAAAPVHIEVQTGVALATIGEHLAAEALLLASAARHDAQLGRCVRHYEAHDSERKRARALRAALEQQQISIALQPKVALDSGALCGFETLARWTLGDGGTVPPSQFIPLAEREGLIGTLGARVMEQALDWAAWARDAGHPTAVAVNVSAPQFHHAGFAQQVREQLRAYSLPSSALELELTESMLLDDTGSALDSLRALHELGLGLAIDDFGTGYSSLSYLSRFPVGRLKLDRSFVARIEHDARDRALVQALIALAHQLGLRCVAEGIETPQQLALLRAYGCDEGQGYLFSHPLSPLAAYELLGGNPPWQALFAPETLNA